MEAIMPKLILVTRDGEEREMDGATGLSVMEVIRDNGDDELLALCGGCLSCATCHVHIDPRFAAKLTPLDQKSVVSGTSLSIHLVIDDSLIITNKYLRVQD